MNNILKGIAIFVFSILVIIYGFFEFGRYLVDYSLENLGHAIETTYPEFQKSTTLERKIYKNVVQDMLLEEAASQEVDYESMMLLQTTMRSMNDPVELVSFERTKIYVDELMKNKEERRSTQDVLKVQLYNYFVQFKAAVGSFIQYIKSRIMPVPERQFQVSDQILLSRAQEKEKEGDLAGARELYEQYLDTYRYRSDRGLVSLALAHILIIQEEWELAGNILMEVQTNFTGGKEADFAATLLKRIAVLKDRNQEIAKLKKQLLATDSKAVKEALHFKLGLTYLAIRRLNQAQEHFEVIQETQDIKLRQRASFYLGWIYKLNRDYEKAESILGSLLNDEQLQSELKLALQVELADIYMLSGNYDKANEKYGEVVEDIQKQSEDRIGALKTWIGISRVESGVIAAQSGNLELLERVMLDLDQSGIDSDALLVLKAKLREAQEIDLRTQAFRKLFIGQVHEAKDLFERYMITKPNDAWAFSGLATCYLLLKNLEEAFVKAKEAVDNLQDEYTLSLLAYVQSFSSDHKDVQGLYQRAITISPKYVPARFNLSSDYLSHGQFEKAMVLLEKLYNEYKYSSNKIMRSKIQNNRGIGYWGIGKKEDAKNALEQAVRLDPTSRIAAENLARINAGEAPISIIQYDMVG